VLLAVNPFAPDNKKSPFSFQKLKVILSGSTPLSKASSVRVKKVSQKRKK